MEDPGRKQDSRKLLGDFGHSFPLFSSPHLLPSLSIVIFVFPCVILAIKKKNLIHIHNNNNRFGLGLTSMFTYQ